MSEALGSYAAGANVPSPRQDTISGLLNAIEDNLSELNNHLVHIQSMICGPQPENLQDKVPPSAPGQLGKLMDLRTATRMLVNRAAAISSNI